MTQKSPTLEQLRERRTEILTMAEKYGAYNVRVFGSVARGEATPDSDIDFLVTFDKRASLFELSNLWQDLRDLLGREVNVISEGGLRERFKKRIERDLIAL